MNKKFVIFDLIGIASILIYTFTILIVFSSYGVSSSDFPFEFQSQLSHRMLFISFIASISVYFSKHRYLTLLAPLLFILLISFRLLISVDCDSKIAGIYCAVSSLLIISPIVYRIIKQKKCENN